MLKNIQSMTKYQLLQIINQQQLGIQSLINERKWLLDDNHILRVEIDKIKVVAINWQRYAQGRLTDEMKHSKRQLERLKADLVKKEGRNATLQKEYHNLEVLFSELKEKYEIDRRNLQFCLNLGTKLYQEYTYYKKTCKKLQQYTQEAKCEQEAFRGSELHKHRGAQPLSITQSKTLALDPSSEPLKVNAPSAVSVAPDYTSMTPSNFKINITEGVVWPIPGPLRLRYINVNTISQLVITSCWLSRLAQVLQEIFSLGTEKTNLAEKLPRIKAYLPTNHKGDCCALLRNHVKKPSLKSDLCKDEVAGQFRLQMKHATFYDTARLQFSASEAQEEKKKKVGKQKQNAFDSLMLLTL